MQVRLAATEYEALHELAYLEGMSACALVRRMVFAELRAAQERAAELRIAQRRADAVQEDTEKGRPL